eukprot:Rmarinus@m.14690
MSAAPLSRRSQWRRLFAILMISSPTLSSFGSRAETRALRTMMYLYLRSMAISWLRFLMRYYRRVEDLCRNTFAYTKTLLSSNVVFQAKQALGMAALHSRSPPNRRPLCLLSYSHSRRPLRVHLRLPLLPRPRKPMSSAEHLLSHLVWEVR